MTPRNSPPAEDAAGPDVQELIRQRELLAGWIARLDEVKTDAPGRVTERVRADYDARLRQVTADLLAHREEIERDLESRRGEQAAAEERRAQAADALEETQLRHLIGELDQGAWDQARPQLEGEVGEAEQALEQARGEVERLSTLAAEIAAAAEPARQEPEEEAPAAGAEAAEAAASGDEPVAAQPAGAESAAAAEPPSQGEDMAAWISEVEAEASREGGPVSTAEADSWDPFANEFGSAPASPATQPGDARDDLPWLDAIDGGGKAAPAAAAGAGEQTVLGGDAPAAAAEASASADLAADDLAFLEELDRAISGGAARPPAAPAAAPTEPSSFTGGSGDGFSLPTSADDPHKKESLLCKECGAINEPQAWYCEICGSEL